ncbi:MAG TPA: 23S rRNA (adenine(2503)-C(2))-methyltransferase RlmN [Phycisphaerales bacterium]|nr:23S rRNA (adenine(2503)-C(2))-methyltransferase RlmN [Phycisphaerales bacterium]
MVEADADAPVAMDPLGLPSAAFVRAAGECGAAADPARKAYRAVFRAGVREVGLGRGVAVRAVVAPIVRELEEETGEGVIRKFVQRLAGEPSVGGADVRRTSALVSRSERLTSGTRGGAGAAPARKPPVAREIPHFDIESVLIPMIGRRGVRSHTLCVSSQVGCAMGCGFCETAQMGLVRSLTPAEIVGQWWAATHERGGTVKNIVFMGMGEPLDNVEAVIDAIAVLTDHNGPAIPMANIMVSTVGKIDGLRRLCEQMRVPGWHKLGIAISINAPNDEIRSRIMPINRATPMAELREAIAAIPHVGTHKKICFGYVLIPGVNDREEHASELAGYLRPFTAGGSADGTHKGMLNLIPYNPRRESPWPAPDEEHVERFLGWIRERGVYAKRRRTKGRDTMAACGQLGAEEIRKRRYVGVRIADESRAVASTEDTAFHGERRLWPQIDTD